MAEERGGPSRATIIWNAVPAVVVALGVVVGYVRLEELALQNSVQIQELRMVVAANRSWQIEQRVRVWNKVGVIEDGGNALRAQVAALDSTMNHVAKQVDRIIERLFDQKS